MINTNFYSPNLLAMDPGYLIGPTTFAPIAPINSPFDNSNFLNPTDSFMLGGDLNSAADFLNQIGDLAGLSRRQQAVSDLNTGDLPPNWDTMPLGDFLDQMAQIRAGLGPSQSQTNPDGSKSGQDQDQGGDKGTFGVNAHRYFDSNKNQYVNVQSVQVHEKGDWNTRGLTTWNSGDSNDLTTSKEEPMGKTMQVQVTWQDGTQKTWDYTNQGQTVDVYSPNS